MCFSIKELKYVIIDHKTDHNKNHFHYCYSCQLKIYFWFCLFASLWGFLDFFYIQLQHILLTFSLSYNISFPNIMCKKYWNQYVDFFNTFDIILNEFEICILCEQHGEGSYNQINIWVLLKDLDPLKCETHF